MIDLKSVVEKYPECLDSATKFKSYMMDLYPDNSNKARIRILADIVDCGIALEIKNGKTDSISISNFCNTMETQYGYSVKLVEECVNQFLVAFGVCDSKQYKTSENSKQSKTLPTKSDFQITNNKNGSDTSLCDSNDFSSFIERSYIRNRQSSISAGHSHTVGIKKDGTVIAVGDNHFGQCDVANWQNIIAVSACHGQTIGLRANGTVVAAKYTGNLDFYKGHGDVDGWTNIVEISAGESHTVGLKLNGTVVATKYLGNLSGYHGQCDVSGWNNIVAISAGYHHTVGLKSDGTVVTTRYINNTGYDFGQCNVANWESIVAVASALHTVGLKFDGTVVAVGSNSFGQCNVDGWNGIVAISVGEYHTVGLRANGTVVATGWNNHGQLNVEEWRDIVAISAAQSHTIGLKRDGSVVSTKYTGDTKYYSGQCDVNSWYDISIPILTGTQKEFDEEKQKQLNEIRDQRNRYQSQGVCQYCGSQFNGFIFKKCSNCGKPKDY